MNFEQILVPVDLSVGSKKVARFAAEMVGDPGALTLLSVDVPPPPLPYGMGTPMGPVRPVPVDRQEMREQARAFADRLFATPRPPLVKVAAGRPSTAILSELEGGDYDIVVMGTEGRTGLDRLIAGSVAETVLRRSPVPVLVCPYDALEPS